MKANNLVGKKFTRNNVIAEITSVNSKFKTVILTFEDGKSQSISTATLLKYWKECDAEVPNEETIEEVPEADVPAVEADVPVAEEPAVEREEPIIEQPVEKAEKPKRAKKDKKPAEGKSEGRDCKVYPAVLSQIEKRGLEYRYTTKYIYCKGIQFYKTRTGARACCSLDYKDALESLSAESITLFDKYLSFRLDGKVDEFFNIVF